MSDLLTIAGVTLEKYADLCVAMADTAGDEAKELAIAAEAGVDAAAWREAKSGFTAKMSDPADAGKTAYAFMPFYQAAQTRKRGGAEPCSIELYAKITAEYSFEKGPDGAKVPPPVVFARHGITAAQWNEYTSYWTPKVNDPADPSSGRFPGLVQTESDRILGIVRGAPAAPAPPASKPAPAAKAPPPVPPAGVGSAAPAPAPPPAGVGSLVAPAVPDDVVPGLTDEEKMVAACVHASVVVGFAMWAPAIVWFMYKDPPKSAFVRWHAIEALKVQVVAFIVVLFIGLLTCGIGTVLLVPWFALELWVAWQAYEGKRAGYPLLPGFPG